MKKVIAYTVIATLVPVSAQARTQAEIDQSCASTYAYPGNNLSAVQASNYRRFWISNSVPSTCQNAVYNGSVTWTNSTVNVKFIWSGYQANDAWMVGPGDTFQMTAYNTGDTWVQGGRFEDPYLWAYAMPLIHGPNSAPNPPQIYKDGDVIYNLNRLSEFHCGTGTTPTGLRDMNSTSLHEYGHVWGLGHDDCDKSTTQAARPVMWWQGFKGVAGEKRVLKTRDIARGQYIYGAK